MIVLSRATQNTAIHEARLIMRSLELRGGCCWACSCSMGSRDCSAFVFALPGILLFMMDGAGEDATIVDVVEASPFSCIVCPRIRITVLIPEGFLTTAMRHTIVTAGVIEAGTLSLSLSLSPSSRS